MKYFISGASGFIGSNYFFKLLGEGHTPKAIPREYLYNYFTLKKFFEIEQPDVIVHFAAWGNHSTQLDLDKIISSNIEVTRNILQASKDVDYKALINTGSSSEYGTKMVPMKESDTLETDTFYGATKVATTFICRAFAKQFSKPIVTVRPFSIYGPREANHRFIPTAILNALDEKFFDLVKEPKHDWTYVDDFLDGIETVIKNIDKLSGKAVNIGSGVEYSNLEVVQTIEKIHGLPIRFNTVESLREFDSNCWQADNSRLKSLGWKPKYSLAKGLMKTYEFFRG